MTAVKPQENFFLELVNNHLVCKKDTTIQFCILCNSTQQLNQSICKVNNQIARKLLAEQTLTTQEFRLAIKFLSNEAALTGLMQTVQS